MYEDGRGRVFVVAAKINNEQEGLAIMGRDGKVATLLGAHMASAWPMMSMDNTPPILLPSGNQFWLPSVGTSEPARLVDLKKMEVVDTLPHPQCNRLYAVSADGRPYVSSTYFGRIMVYTPQAKNTEKARCRSSHTEVLSPEPIRITEEGSVWTEGPDGLVRFRR